MPLAHAEMAELRAMTSGASPLRCISSKNSSARCHASALAHVVTTTLYAIVSGCLGLGLALALALGLGFGLGLLGSGCARRTQGRIL